jgi:hypothetical protein
VSRDAKALWCGLVALLAGASASAQLVARAQSAESVVWHVIVAEDGAQLGHGSLEVVMRDDGRDVIENQEVYLREQGGEPTRISARSLRSEDAHGRTVSMSETTRRARFVSHTLARIDGDSAHLVRETPSGRWTETVALPPDVRFDGGEGLLSGWDAASRPRLAFESFNIDAMGVERVVIEAAPGAVRDAAGRLAVLRRRYEGGELRGVARLVVDRDGRVVEVAQPMFGETIRTRVTDRATAQRPHPPYQVVPNLMTRSPFRISSAAAQGHIRYRFAFRDGVEFSPPRTGEQSVMIEPGALTIDICADCGPGLPADAATLADALRNL